MIHLNLFTELYWSFQILPIMMKLWYHSPFFLTNATSGVLLSSQRHVQKKGLHVSQVGLLRFSLPVNSSQKHTICRPRIISFFSYLFAPQVSSSLQRVSCMEIEASCSRKSEKQHSKQGWSSKPTTLLPRAPERAAQKHPSMEITSGSHLLSLGLCIRGIHFIPWEMKGRAGQGAKKLGSVWWDFPKKQNSYLHLFGVSQRGNRRLRTASCQPKVAMKHLTEILPLLAAVTGAWRAVLALNTSPHRRLV